MNLFLSCARENPTKVFEVFVEVARPSSSDEHPFIIQKYPEEYDDKVKMIIW